MVIVPTLDAKKQIFSFLKNKWKRLPFISVFPSRKKEPQGRP